MSPTTSPVARVELFHVAIPLPATFRPAWIPGMPSNENRSKRFFVMDRKRLIWFSLRHRGIKASKEIDRARRARIGEA